MHRLQKITFALFPLVLFLVLVSPSRSSASEQAPKDSFRLRLTDDPSTLDWNLAHSSHESYLLMNIMRGLTRIGPKLQPEPELAESWKISEDGRVIDFFIKKNIKWSDGVALVAQSFADSWLRLLDPKLKANYASFLFDIEGAKAYQSGQNSDPKSVGIQVLGEHHLRIQLARPTPYFLYLPSFWVTFPIRKDLIEKHGSQWSDPSKMATLGAYRIAEWARGTRVILEKISSASSGPERVEIMIQSDDEAARKLFLEQKIDVLMAATTSDLIKLRGLGSPFRMELYPYLSTFYLGFNTQKKLMKNAHLRKAIAHAIRTAEIPAILEGGQQTAFGWIPPGVLGARKQALITPSVYEARGFLVKGGYAEGQGIPKLKMWIERFDGANKLGDFMSANFREQLGIQLRVQFGTPAEYQAAVKRGDADLFVGHWGADFPDPHNFFAVFTSDSGNNRTGWQNSTYDQLINKARNSLDEKKRAELYGRAEKILTSEEAVVIPLFHQRNTVLLGSRVEKFAIDPLNYLHFSDIKLK